MTHNAELFSRVVERGVCGGCKTFERVKSDGKNQCIIYAMSSMHRWVSLRKIEICPCQTCLVKGICSNVCDEYKEMARNAGYQGYD